MSIYLVTPQRLLLFPYHSPVLNELRITWQRKVLCLTVLYKCNSVVGGNDNKALLKVFCLLVLLLLGLPPTVLGNSTLILSAANRCSALILTKLNFNLPTVHQQEMA